MPLDDVVRRLRPQQGGHVLDADRVRAHVLEPLGHLNELIDRVQRRGRVADRPLCVLAGAADGVERAAEVANVIQSVENAEHVHAVLGRLAHEAIDDRIFVVPVAQQVLAAQQHLQAGIGHQLAKGAQPLPRVFVEKSDAGVVGGAAPAFHAPETCLVDGLAGSDQVLGRHPRGEQTLVAVAESQLRDFDHS